MLTSACMACGHAALMVTRTTCPTSYPGIAKFFHTDRFADARCARVKLPVQGAIGVLSLGFALGQETFPIALAM